MRAARVFLPLVAFVVACGPRTTAPDLGRTAEPAKARRAEARRSASASPAGDPCAPLGARLVRNDTAGQPFAFTFEMPEGFVVKDFSRGETVHADVTFDLDGKGGDDYVLRIVYNTKVLENPEGLVEVWRKLPVTLKVLEKDVEGRTMYVQRTKVGEMSGFVALFPSPGDPSAAYSVLGGLTNTPKPCRGEAAEVLERMVMSFERNPRVGEIPAK